MAKNQNASSQTQIKNPNKDKDEVETQRYLIKYKDINSKDKGHKKITDSGGKILKNFKGSKVVVAELELDSRIGLVQDSDIALIEPDFSVAAQEDMVTWGMESSNITLAHSQGFMGEDINIAIFDTGINPHIDLNVKGGVSFVNGVSSYYDDNGHGTHVAGIIGGLYNNQGIVGVSPSANIYSVKTLAEDGRGTYSSIIEGIYWAIENNINIINMSFGGSNYSKIFEEALKEAYDNNILIFASAGNSGSEINYPAKFPSVVAVGAVNENEVRADFSSIGPELELMAPGVNIYSTINVEDYDIKSGTSMASAYASGVAALLWSTDKTLSNNDLRNVLRNSTKGTLNEKTYGYGLIDFEKGLREIQENNNYNTEDDSALESEDNHKDYSPEESQVMINHGSSFGTATNIVSFNTSISGSIGQAGEQDYFKFTAPLSGVYTIQTEGTTDTFGHLYNSAYTAIAEDDDSGETINFKISHPLAAGQTYYIKIRYFNNSGTGAYTLRITPPADDHSNTFSGATVINTNSSTSANINYGADEDFFRFVAPITGVYTIETTGSIDTFGNIYNNSWVQLAQDDDGGANTNFKISHSLTVGQTYFIKVRHYSNTGTGGYTLKLTPPPDDHGNAFASATIVNVNPTILANINYGGDEDFFKFTAPMTGTYAIETTGTTDTFGHLYNSSYTQLVQDDDSGAGINFKISHSLTAGQTYFIRIRHYSNTGTGVYTLQLTPPADDHGNAFSTATVAGINTSVSGNINYGGDEDFFRFTATSSGNFVIKTTGSTDTFGHLYDSSYSQLKQNDDDGAETNFEITYNLTAGQTYFVKVRHYNNTGSGAYTLRIEESPEWYYFEVDTGSTGIVKVYMDSIAGDMQSNQVAEAKVLYNDGTILSSFQLSGGNWNETAMVASIPGDNIDVTGLDLDEDVVEAMAFIAGIRKKTIDIPGTIDRVIARFEENLGIDLSSLVTEDHRAVANGIIHSVDNNVFFGLIQRITRASSQEDSYYYMRAKTYTDTHFLTVFTMTTLGTAAAAIEAWKTAGISGGLAIATSPSGAGAVAFGTTAATQAAAAVAMTGVSYASSYMMARSQNNFTTSLQKLKETIGYKLRNIADDIVDIMEGGSHGGHTILKHIDKSDDYLKLRAMTEGVDSSSFTDKTIATKAIKETLAGKADDIANWLISERYGPTGSKAFDFHTGTKLGNGVKAGTTVVEEGLEWTRVVLIADEAHELGFRLISAFPIVRK